MAQESEPRFCLHFVKMVGNASFSEIGEKRQSGFQRVFNTTCVNNMKNVLFEPYNNTELSRIRAKYRAGEFCLFQSKTLSKI